MSTWLSRLTLALLVAATPWLMGCESCKLSLGVRNLTAQLSAPTPPLALRVRLCTTTEAQHCEEVPTGATEVRCEDQRDPAEGDACQLRVKMILTPTTAGFFNMGACAYAHHYLIIEADGCRREVVDVGKRIDRDRPDIETLRFPLSCETP